MNNERFTFLVTLGLFSFLSVVLLYKDVSAGAIAI